MSVILRTFREVNAQIQPGSPKKQNVERRVAYGIRDHAQVSSFFGSNTFVKVSQVAL
jgi:hypothetical protein